MTVVVVVSCPIIGVGRAGLHVREGNINAVGAIYSIRDDQQVDGIAIGVYRAPPNGIGRCFYTTSGKNIGANLVGSASCSDVLRTGSPPLLCAPHSENGSACDCNQSARAGMASAYAGSGRCSPTINTPRCRHPSAGDCYGATRAGISAADTGAAPSLTDTAPL